MMKSFFNVNGCIGRGAYEKPEFPTAGSLVEHLDYLQIDRSLVWHVEARDLNPMRGNRRLLQEITDSGKQERLHPAFVITPACFFEEGVLDFLCRHFSSGRVRALQMAPQTSRFEIRETERVLGQLARFEPVLLWNCGEKKSELDMRDIEHLAKVFPKVSFVLTQKSWSGFSRILDLMWRCPNVYVDTSKLHMRDALGLLTENFGADRVLFGLSYKADYGAAIGALMHAGLTSDQGELIAHGNIERLLKIEPVAKNLYRTPEILKKKTLWNDFRAGKPVKKEVEVLDAHGHTPPHTRGWVMKKQNIGNSPAELKKKMDALGVNKLVLSSELALFGECVSGNREAEKIFMPHRDRFAGYFVFNPLYGEELTPAMDDFFKRGFFVGFKLLPSYWKIPSTAPSYAELFKPVWEYAHQHNLPILLHTWGKVNFLADIVKKYPNANFLLGHSGGTTGGRLEAEALALEYDNVYLEFCGSFCTPRPFETSMQIVGKERVLFGSDTSAHDQAWELARYLSLPIPDEELRPGLAANLRKIMNV